MIIRLRTILLTILCLSVWTSAQELRKFKGKLEDDLRPDMVHVYQRIFEASPATMVKFAPAVSKGAKITSGTLNDLTLADGKRVGFLIEDPASKAFLGIDLDKDGTIRADERFNLTPNDGGALEAVIKIPIKHKLFKSFPIFIRFYAGFTHPQLPKTSRLLEQSVWALAFGKVKIENEDVLFQYPFDAMLPSISTTEGLFGVDVDGDGRIRNEQFSPETSFAQGDELVFRYGKIYLSTSSINLDRNEITVRERKKEEYFKIELEIGKVMPDFKFVDFGGKERSLSEFRGKYVLVDFWGLWCIDCLQETPYHVEAYERFRSRGFDILSINTDEDMTLVVEYAKKNRMGWTQARHDSVKQLIERDYRIQEYPSTILLDPEGRVLVLDQKRLRGDRLISTLEQYLPK